MKATELLQEQHRDIEALLDKLHTGGHGDERSLRQELAAHLVAHTVIEQEIFYPAVQAALPEEILEAIEEHGLADVELARLLAAKIGDASFEAKASVLSEVVLNHIRREESEIFRVAEREREEEHLHQLGDEMAARFRQIIEGGYSKHLQKALEDEVPRTTARRTAAKKTARRAPAAKTAKTTRRAAAKKPRATPRRAPAKRVGAKLGQTTRATRGSVGTTRTRA